MLCNQTPVPTTWTPPNRGLRRSFRGKVGDVSLGGELEGGYKKRLLGPRFAGEALSPKAEETEEAVPEQKHLRTQIKPCCGFWC